MRLIQLLFFFIFFVQSGPAQTDPPIRVMTFNIRYPNPGDGVNYWPNRKELVASMIRYHEADLVGVQEAFRSQLSDLMELLPGYEWYGVCRTDGSTDPDPDNEFSAILYRADRFERLGGATFWLSETPDEAGSQSWDASLPRIVTWARFRDKQNGETFYHFNTHFDHRGAEARLESARLILKRIRRVAGEAPVVLTGDFNCVETDPPYRYLTAPDNEGHLLDGRLGSEQPPHGPLGTWSGFQFPGEPGRRIDYIFVNGRWSVHRYATLSESWSGRFPSDHLPVLAELRIR